MKEDTLEEWSRNVSRRDRFKAEYREILGQLTHKELLEYIVERHDGVESYESPYLNEHARFYVAEKVKLRGELQNKFNMTLPDGEG